MKMIYMWLETTIRETQGSRKTAISSYKEYSL